MSSRRFSFDITPASGHESPLKLRFLFALAASFALHLALFGSGAIVSLLERKVSPRNTAMQAHLLPPVTLKPPEAVLKDTIAEQESTKSEPVPPKPDDVQNRRPAPRAQEKVAQRKLSDVLFYPPEARQQGLEGDVYLMLTLDENKVIRNVQIAASSGHKILDEAAVKSAYAMGSKPSAERREVIQLVQYRLK